MWISKHHLLIEFSSHLSVPSKKVLMKVRTPIKSVGRLLERSKDHRSEKKHFKQSVSCQWEYSYQSTNNYISWLAARKIETSLIRKKIWNNLSAVTEDVLIKVKRANYNYEKRWWDRYIISQQNIKNHLSVVSKYVQIKTWFVS